MPMKRYTHNWESVDRVLLLEKLKTVLPGVSKQEMLEQSSSFVLSRGKVTTYNDEISVQSDLPLTSVKGAVVADEMIRLLSKMKDERISVSVQLGELRVKGKRSKAGIKIHRDIVLPLLDVNPDCLDWFKCPTGFVDALLLASKTVAKDTTRPVLTCIHVNGPVVESCDNECGIRRYIKVKGMNRFKNILVQGSSVKHLVGFNPTHVCIQKKWIHFLCSNGATFSCRMVHGKYPDIGKFFDGGKNARDVFLRSSFVGILDRAGIFSKRAVLQDESVEVSLKSGAIQIAGFGDTGWYKERAKCSYEGDPFTFLINPSLLRSVLSEDRNAVVCENRVIVDCGSYKYVAIIRKPSEGEAF